MRRGDRDAAAAFMERFASRIRRRVRGKLSPTVRRLFDSLDVMSSISRRLDLYVRSGQVEAANEAQLWALVQTIANRTVIDKARVFRRLQRVEGDDSALAHEIAGRMREADRASRDGAEEFIDRAVSMLDDDVDRLILTYWLTETPFAVIAEIVSMTPAAVRKRWERIRATLASRLSGEGRHGHP